MGLRWLFAIGLGLGLSGCGGGPSSKPSTTDDAGLVDLSRRPVTPAPGDSMSEPTPSVAPTPTSEAPPVTLAPRQPFSMAPEQSSSQTSMPPIPGSSPLAGVCDSDSDCASGLRCFTVLGQATSGTISIGRGYCSVACSESSACAARFGAGSSCDIPFYMGVSGFCTAPCSPGGDDAEKCGGRHDLVCFGSPGQTGSCDLQCETDTDCGGAHCDISSGQCVRGPGRNSTPVGSACPSDEPFTCTGFCVGEDNEPRLCTGRCRLGSSCSGPSNACVPADPGLRRGDFGLCERSCTSSADCTPGVTQCAPTGFLSAAGQPERTCAAVHPGPSFLNQRLSVEEQALLVKFPRLVAINGFSAGDTRFQLSGSGDGVCLTGTRDAAGDPAVLELQLGSNDPVPFDASAFSSIVLDTTGDASVQFEAQLSNQPGIHYLNFAAPELSLQLAAGRHSLPFSTIAGRNAGDPAWDPSQLEAVRLIVGGAPGPFNVCLTELGFE